MSINYFFENNKNQRNIILISNDFIIFIIEIYCMLDNIKYDFSKNCFCLVNKAVFI